jgi:hypothetical protein
MIPEGAKRAAQRYVEEVRSLPRKFKPAKRRVDDAGPIEFLWSDVPTVVLKAKDALNALCEDLHPEDRVLMAQQLAQCCAVAAEKIKAHNDRFGVPERASRGMKPDVVPRIE